MTSQSKGTINCLSEGGEQEEMDIYQLTPHYQRKPSTCHSKQTSHKFDNLPHHNFGESTVATPALREATSHL